jgi:acetoacetyl-CoA synthetase
MTATITAPTLVPANVLSTEPKCLWTPSNPQDTEMEKFRVLMQSKYKDTKLGMKF